MSSLLKSSQVFYKLASGSNYNHMIAEGILSKALLTLAQKDHSNYSRELYPLMIDIFINQAVSELNGVDTNLSPDEVEPAREAYQEQIEALKELRNAIDDEYDVSQIQAKIKQTIPAVNAADIKLITLYGWESAYADVINLLN